VYSWVTLDVLDGKGDVVSSRTTRLIQPLPFSLARGSYFGDELRTPTRGAHDDPNWSWRIRCVSEPEVAEEPLDPPVPDRVVYQPPPMYIKDRSWQPSYPASVNLMGPDLTTGQTETQACRHETYIIIDRR
jgi:hypothetical protein